MHWEQAAEKKSGRESMDIFFNLAHPCSFFQLSINRKVLHIDWMLIIVI